MRVLTGLFLVLIFQSCSPVFDLNKEEQRIRHAVENDVFNKESLGKKIDVFFPKDYWQTNDKEDFYKTIDSLWNTVIDPFHSNSTEITKYNLSVNNVSNQIKIKDRYFVIININEAFDIIKPVNIDGVDNLEKYIKRNLIPYLDDSFKLIVNSNSDLLGVYDINSKSWVYFDLNENVLQYAYGIKDTQKLINHYFEEVFQYSEEKWTNEETRDFKEMYKEQWDYVDWYKYLDFDKYCECKIEYQKKWPEDIPDEYFEQSEAMLKSIYRCRIYATNMKKYETKKIP